jgi:ketosteroid isomerase-like protein
MKHTITGLAIFAAAAASAAAQQPMDIKTTCARGDDARIIEVVAPGSVGQSCDVRYTRGGGANVSVPYHADNSDAFCNQKAREMVQRLASAGYACSAAPPALRADAAPAPASDYVVETRRAEPAPAAQPPAAEIVEQPAPAAAAEPEARLQSTPAAAPELASLEAEGDADDGLEDSMSEILAQPSLAATSGEPAQLVAQHADVSGASAPAAGDRRLMGADPSAPQSPSPKPAASVTQASAQAEPAMQEAPAPAAAAPAPQTGAAPAAASAATPPKTPSAAPLRTPQDVIRATLMAQAAAWNEGNLDAFMGTYWKSEDLKFVSGINVTRGWDATLKRYRERYAGGTGLGALSFENIDVKMITDDVSTVTGRYKLVRDGAPSGGVFSLVMRRDNGAWRIVHDHTSADPVIQ